MLWTKTALLVGWTNPIRDHRVFRIHSQFIEPTDGLFVVTSAKAHNNQIEIGARFPGTPLTTPSMRGRTRRFVLREQVRSRDLPD